MGEVFRARDSKLKRDVALKVLPAAFSRDADRMARFQREAQVLASLNHPNIAQIYGVEENAIVMELVEGEVLRGPLPLHEALDIARQIAEALEAAHEKGIVHRDLKPGNVLVTPDGVVKVLDFGLAKIVEQSACSGDISSSPTLSIQATEAGVIMGTAGYMAPEQAAGRPLDKRADIWSFGVVLWEMLTGKALFAGETVSHTLANVLRGDIDFNQLPQSTPPAVKGLLRRCLERNAKSRLRDIGEARIAIQDYLANPGEQVAQKASAPVSARRVVAPWAITAILTIVAAVLVWRATRPAPLRAFIRLSAEIAPDLSMSRGSTGAFMALSPDGSRIALAMGGSDGKTRLCTRLLRQNQVTQLEGTEDAGTPFFSPDGQWIGFAAAGKLKKIPVEGGAAVTLCDVTDLRGASWGDNGTIVLTMAPAADLSQVSSAGGTPAPLTKRNPEEVTHRWPQVLPGSHAVLFTSHTNFGAIGNYEDANIEVVLPKTGERKIIQRGGYSGRYLAASEGAGYLVYMRRNTLFAASFDLNRLAITGPPVPVLEDVGADDRAGGDFTFSQTGTLAYLPGKEVTDWTISWLSVSGKTQPLHAVPGMYLTPRLSPDGKRLAFAIGNGSGSDLWVKDLDRDTLYRLTFLHGNNRAPVWTPDGKTIVFVSDDSKAPGLYWIHSDGSGEAQKLLDGKGIAAHSISPDGKRLALSTTGNRSNDILTAPFEGDPGHVKLGRPELFLGTPFTEDDPVFSPDGHWLAYVSSESGRFEVYVRPFPGPGGRWQISTGSATSPRWLRDGQELLFEGPDRRIMAVRYAAKGDTFTAGTPRVWSEIRLRNLAFSAKFDPAPDGKRVVAFLASDEQNQKPITHLMFLLNFVDEIQRRMPGRSR